MNLTFAQAANELGISYRMVQKLASRGAFAVLVISAKCKRIPRVSFDEFLRRRTIKSKSHN